MPMSQTFTSVSQQSVELKNYRY